MDDIDTKAYKFPSIQPPGLRKAKPEFYVVNCKGEWHHGGALSLSNTFQARGGKGFQAVAWTGEVGNKNRCSPDCYGFTSPDIA